MPKFFNTLEAQVGDFTIQNSADDKDLIFKSDNGSGGLTEYFRLDGSTTSMQASKNIVFADSIRATFGGGADSSIYHDTNDTRWDNSTGHIIIQNLANDRDIKFRSDDGSGGTTEYFRVDGGDTNIVFSKNLFLNDDVNLGMGNGGDYAQFHDGTNTYLSNGTGDFYIRNQADDKDILFQADDGSGGNTTYFFLDGSATVTVFKKDARFNDNIDIKLGTSNDASIFHDGTNTYIDNGTGDLVIRNQQDDGDIIFYCDDGSGGLEEYFRLDGSAGSTNPVTVFPDSSYLKFGSSQDFSFVHNGSQSYIQNFTGDLQIQNNADDKDILFRCDDGSGGLTTYFYLDGSLASGGSVFTVFPDNSSIVLGTGNDLQAKHNGTDTTFDNYTGDLKFQNYADNKDIVFSSDDGSGGLTEYFKLDGSSASGGTVYTNWADNSRITLGAGNDMQLYHDGSNNYVDITLGDLYFTNYADDKDIIFRSDDGSGGTATYMFLDGSNTRVQFNKDARFVDNAKVMLGSSDDLQIKHDGTNSEVSNLTGNLNIKNTATDGDISFYADDGSGGSAEYFRLDGSQVAIRMKRKTKWDDNIKATFGDGEDLEIYHDGSDSIIKDGGTGSLDILSSHVHIKSSGGTSNMAQFFSGGHSYIYANNVLRIEATTSGASITGALTINGGTENLLGSFVSTDSIAEIRIEDNSKYTRLLTVGTQFKIMPNDGSETLILDGNNDSATFAGDVILADSKKALFGASEDLQIYHNGTNSIIDNNTGDLIIRSDGDDIKILAEDDVVIRDNDDSTEMAKFINGGAVELYHNGSKKFETTSAGVDINGHAVSSSNGRLTVSGDFDVTSNIVDRKIPCIVTTGWGDDVSTTSNRIIPLGNSVTDTTISAADGFHFVVMPYAGNVKKIVMKNVAGTLSSSFTTELKLYKNGANVTSSGELTASSSAITWEPSSSNTFSANDEISLVYQKSASSKYWREVSLTMVLEFTGQDI